MVESRTVEALYPGGTAQMSTIVPMSFSLRSTIALSVQPSLESVAIIEQRALHQLNGALGKHYRLACRDGLRARNGSAQLTTKRAAEPAIAHNVQHLVPGRALSILLNPSRS